MIGKLNHVAIAVPDLEAGSSKYRNVFGAEVSGATDMAEHGVTTVFVNLPNTKIELISPLGENSPIAKFLERNPKGGVHHLCYEVENIPRSFETSEYFASKLNPIGPRSRL